MAFAVGTKVEFDSPEAVADFAPHLGIGPHRVYAILKGGNCTLAPLKGGAPSNARVPMERLVEVD